ncbi:hypothetical protein AArcCO_4121 (plasmid) [Halalkaliarchaeum sp. AArc-CO]|nr:hypothetical protein AArcCO_4121 [Halalkaliarchaeum sp. AArc-CO]
MRSSVEDFDDCDGDFLVGVVGSQRDPAARVGFLRSDLFRNDHAGVFWLLPHRYSSASCMDSSAASNFSASVAGSGSVAPRPRGVLRVKSGVHETSLANLRKPLYEDPLRQTCTIITPSVG